MSWFKRQPGYKRPSGRAISRRYGENSGLFKRRQYFWQRRSFKIYLILAFLVLIFLAYLLFWSSLFKIQNINIIGAVTTDSAQIEQIVRQQLIKSRFGVFSQSNLLFFDAKTAQNEVQNTIVLESIKISKRPLKTLKIKAIEKASQVTLISNNRYYYLDPNGIAIKEVLVANLTLVEGEASKESAKAPGEELTDMSVLDSNLPLVYDLKNSPVEVGKKFLEPQTIDFILTLTDKLPKNDIKFKYFQLPEKGSNEVRVVIDRGYSIYFNTQDDFDRQLANLKLVLNEKVKDKKINYIDLRFGNRVYIK